MSWTIRKWNGGSPGPAYAVRPAQWDPVRHGNFIGTAHNVIGRSTPVVVYAGTASWTTFELSITILSKAEYDNIMAILLSGDAFDLDTHHGHSLLLRVVGDVREEMILAQPTFAEIYSTRYAYKITMEVVEVGE